MDGGREGGGDEEQMKEGPCAKSDGDDGRAGERLSAAVGGNKMPALTNRADDPTAHFLSPLALTRSLTHSLDASPPSISDAQDTRED